MTDALPEPVHIPLTPEQAKQVGRWRRLAVVLGVVALLNPVATALAMIKLTSLAEDNHDALMILKETTGPEAQARSTRAVTTIVQAIDCNTRKALQDAFDQLHARGEIGQVTVVCVPAP